MYLLIYKLFPHYLFIHEKVMLLKKTQIFFNITIQEAEEMKKYGYETILLANSSCPPYIGGGMGKTISELNICKEKIENIYKLVNTNLNISEVADKVGYKNNGYFSKIFFEQFNLKPNEVRKKIKNN